MTDIFPGAMTMVKIDGAKVKLLREKQGLTQLYIATAVQVTTDTISRWENKRYPSIKKENGLNLAEALGVDLEDLLETPTDDSPQVVHTPEKIASISKKKWPFLLIAVVCTTFLGGTGYFYFKTPPPVLLLAERTLPVYCISGQSFPVIIKVTGAPASSTALILKEEFPENAKIIKTIPEVNSAGIKNTKIKWLKKIKPDTLFSYTLVITENKTGTLLFDGNIAVNNSSSISVQITGDTEISMGEYHWADGNGDNIISDNEILTVYDRYSEIKGFGLDFDLIEEMWLGSGYSWNKETSSFVVFE